MAIEKTILFQRIVKSVLLDEEPHIYYLNPCVIVFFPWQWNSFETIIFVSSFLLFFNITFLSFVLFL